ncbi:hypothetical protein HUW51_08770 [Adhaeribacter swui]|uniref:Uncharacterized protein n=2 Tax=Adhaeribacter swui TaxID=2086471 RepID=A0A7G7G6N5_9BACT|nr:hypothetical protein HUW51_08770 [Adhaeribacter swui]
MIEVNWYNPKTSSFLGPNPYKPQPIRNYITYKLIGQNNHDRATLRLAQAEIRKQKLQNDTIQGVRFYFEAKAKYGSLVKAFDICLQEDVKGYLPYQSDIWVFNLPQPKEETYSSFGICNHSWDYMIDEKSEIQRKITFIINALQQYWPSFLLLLLLSISILFQKRRNTTW